MSAEEKDALLKEFHPDYRDVGFDTLRVGVNKGDKVPVELRALLEGKSRVPASTWTLSIPITMWTCSSSAAAARAPPRRSWRTRTAPT